MSSGTPTQSDLYSCTPDQLTRLATYRAAVNAGFYTDEIRTPPMDARFARTGIVRPVSYRAAVQAGRITDASQTH